MPQRKLIASSHRLRLVFIASAVLLALASAIVVRSARSGETGSDASPRGGARLNASRVVSHVSCVDCHRAEVAAWQRMKHSSQVFDYLLGDSASKYAQDLGIAVEEITRTSMCMDCHGTRTQNYLGHAKAIAGVSCEACHNPAGGEDGWLNVHAVYGPVGTRREEELVEHYVERAERCRRAGQIRPSDLYLMAKRCLSCHIVGNEQLVDVAGHRLSGDRFELLKYMSGEVRHNFHLNQQHNAVVSSLWVRDLHYPNRSAEARMRTVYVVGQLVKAETVLRHLASANDPEGAFAEELANLFQEALDSLEDADVDELVDLADSGRDLGDRLLDGDFEQGDEEILEAAEAFATLAQKYAAGDGDNLEDVERPNIDATLEEAYQP